MRAGRHALWWFFHGYGLRLDGRSGRCCQSSVSSGRPGEIGIQRSPVPVASGCNGRPNWPRQISTSRRRTWPAGAVDDASGHHDVATDRTAVMLDDVRVGLQRVHVAFPKPVTTIRRFPGSAWCRSLRGGATGRCVGANQPRLCPGRGSVAPGAISALIWVWLTGVAVRINSITVDALPSRSVGTSRVSRAVSADAAAITQTTLSEDAITTQRFAHTAQRGDDARCETGHQEAQLRADHSAREAHRGGEHPAVVRHTGRLAVLTEGEGGHRECEGQQLVTRTHRQHVEGHQHRRGQGAVHEHRLAVDPVGQLAEQRPGGQGEHVGHHHQPQRDVGGQADLPCRRLRARLLKIVDNCRGDEREKMTRSTSAQWLRSSGSAACGRWCPRPWPR